MDDRASRNARTWRRWATSVIDSLPGNSSTDDGATWEPSGGIAIPSDGGQRLGMSGRTR
jgi:hypothetical protein